MKVEEVAEQLLVNEGERKLTTEVNFAFSSSFSLLWQNKTFQYCRHWSRTCWWSGRGGGLTSLDASYARFFMFWRTSPKHCIVRKNQNVINVKNIANLHREHDVLIFFKLRQKHWGRWFCQEHWQHIASLRKMNIAHPYLVHCCTPSLCW